MILLVLNVVVNNPYCHNLIRAALNEKIKNYTRLAVSYQALEVKLFPPSITFYGVAVAPRDALDDKLLEAAHLSARVSLISMVLGKLRLASLEFNELETVISPDRPFDQFFVPPANVGTTSSSSIEWPPNYTIPIDQLIFINSALRLVVPDQGSSRPPALDVRLGGLNLDLNIADLANFSGKIGVHALDLYTWGRHVARSARIETRFVYRNNVLSSRDLQLSSQDAHLKGDLSAEFDVAKVSLGNGPLVNRYRNQLKGIKLAVKSSGADCDLGVLGRFLAIDETEGVVRGNVNLAVDIPLENDLPLSWQVDGKAAVQHGRLYGFNLYDSEVSYLVNDRSVAFPEINVVKDGKVFGNAKGKINLDDEISFDFSVAPKDIPLSDLLSSLKVPGFEVVDTLLASASVRIAGKGFPFHMTVESAAISASDIVSPLIKFETGRFSKPPSCTGNLFMDIDEQRLAFRQTGLICRDNNRESAAMPISGDSRIDVNGDVFFNKEKGVDMRLYSSSLSASVAQYYTQIPWQGSLAADIKIAGPYERIGVTANVSSQNLTLFGTHFQKMRGIFNVFPHENRVVIKDLALNPQAGGKIELSEGIISLDDQLSSVLSGQIDAVEPGLIKNISSWIDPKLTIDFGIQSSHFKVTGPLLFPLAYQGNIKARLISGSLNEERLFSVVDGDITNINGNWQTRNFQYNIEDLQFHLDIGHKRRYPFSWQQAVSSDVIYEKLGLSKDDQFQITLGTGQFYGPSYRTRYTKKNEDQLQKIPFVGNILRDAAITGKLNLSMELEGPLDRLQGHFKGGISRLTLLSSSVGPLTMEGFINGGEIDIPTLTQASKSLIGRFKIDLHKPEMPFEWYLNFNKYDLRALTPEIFHQDPRNYSYISGRWKMKGDMASFWRSACSMEVDDFKINYSRDVEDRVQKENMFLDQPVVLICDKQHWRLADEKGVTIRGSAGYLRVRTLDNILPDNLDIAIDGRAKLAILPKFVPFIDKAAGIISMAGTIQGHITKPDINLTISDTSSDPVTEEDKEAIDISFLDFPPSLRNVNFELAYHHNMFELRKFHAEKGSLGRIQAAGIISLVEDDASHSQIQINFARAEMNRFPIPFIKTLDTTISGNLVLTGNDLPLKLAGVINVDKAQSYANFDIRDQILENFQKKKFSSIAIPQDPLLMLDIKVLANDTIKIKNRSVNAVVSTDLSVKGTDSAPLLGGNITIPEGKFTYKREFTLKQGNIIFDEMISPPDPRLDITGSTVVSNYAVNVAVNGFASDPKVSLSIDPSNRADGSAISKKDILMLLSSGKNPNTTTDTNMEKELSNEALYLLLGQFEHPIERLFDLTGQTVVRQIYLDVHASKDTGDPIPRVNLPINLSDDANLILQVDRESSFRLSYEYSLNEAVSIYGNLDKAREDARNNKDSSLSSEAEPGVDLKFRFSFP